jgi:PAS domain S-box-containing protein
VLASFPEARTRILQIIDDVWNGETVRVDDQPMPYPQEGAVEHASFTACLSPVRDEGGAIVALSAVIVETSDRVRAAHRRDQVEADLREREERYRHIVEVATDYAILTADAESIIESWSPGAEVIFGWTADEAIGQPIAMTFTPEDRATGQPEWELATARDNGVAPDVRWHMRKDGSRVYIDGVTRALRAADASFRGVLKIGQDVTERMRTEQALRASEERFRTLIQHSADGIQLIAADGTILYSSDSIASVLGYRPAEIAGRTIAPFIHPDDLPEVMTWMTEVAASPGNVGGRQYRVRHKNGSWAWLETTIANHLDTPTIEAIVGNFRNVTERKRAEADRQAFMEAAAHDLRSPLAAVKAQTQLQLRRLQRGLGEDRAALEAGLARIANAADRMVALIDDMMDAAYLRDARPLDLRRTRTNLVTLARTAAEDARRSTDRHTVYVDADRAEVTGEWDSARLTRVLSNLLGNAVKYSPDGGDVVVRVRSFEADGVSEVELAVSDQGIGIPPADLPHLFERFHRAANVGAIDGTGIGLAGVRQIVEQHGGTIMAISEEGHGSTFTVRLPMAERDNG